MNADHPQPEPAPTERFHDRADDYARSRPSYPDAAVAAILQGITADPPHVADLGAGTGILSRLLADRGAVVTALEPNASMRDAAAPHPRVQWAAGTAEATGLPDGAFDAVTVAQAWHWFDAGAALRECQRILRPRGRLVILWNRRSREDPFTLGYRTILEQMDAEAPAERSAFDPQSVTASCRFGPPTALQFVNAQGLTLEHLLGRVRSTSTVPRSGPRCEAILDRMRALHEQHRGTDGLATMVYRTELFVYRALVWSGDEAANSRSCRL